MVKLINLLKINARDYLNFYKILNAGSFKEKFNAIFRFIFTLLVYGMFGIYVYVFALVSLDTFNALKLPHIILGEFFAFASIMSLLTSIFLVDSLIYNSKDYDLLSSLPIKKSTIITSKMLNLYFSNLLITLVIMLPTLIAYVRHVAVIPMFYILYFLSMLVIPLIPTILAIIIGSFITILTSRFKLKKLLQFLALSLFLAIYLIISFKTSTLDDFNFASIGQSFVNIFNKIYPLTKVYLDLLINFKYSSLAIFLGISIGLYIIATIIISLMYKNVISKLQERTKAKNYILKKIKKSNSFKSLLKKETKRFFSSPTYVFNSSIGVILLIVFSILLIFVNPEKLSIVVGITNLTYLINTKGPLVLGLLLMLSCTTSSSISLEGKNIWILKSIPIKTEIIFLSKIMLNFLILFIPSIFVTITLVLIFKLKYIYIFIFLLTALLYSLFISILGLIINLHFPVLNWQNEVRVIKQSLATFLTLVCGIALGLLPLVLNLNLSKFVYLSLVDLIILVLIILLSIYLNTVGKKLFIKLN